MSDVSMSVSLLSVARAIWLTRHAGVVNILSLASSEDKSETPSSEKQHKQQSGGIATASAAHHADDLTRFPR